MSVSVFAQAMKEAIQIYRGMLRKYLPQTKRMNKLRALDLTNRELYKDDNDAALYRLGYAITTDIKNDLLSNLARNATSGYYSYSGVDKFRVHLENFLSNYEIEGDKVVHRSQKASRALIQAIQLLALPKEKLTPEIADQLSKCNKIIADFGSEEQRELHKTTLQSTIRQQHDQHTSFYRAILNNFQHQLQETQKSG